MQVENVCRQGNTLQVTFKLTPNNQSYDTYNSPEYIISGAVAFEVFVGIIRVSKATFILIKFFKVLENDNLTYTIQVSSNELAKENQNFISDKGRWHLLYYEKTIKSSFDVTVHMDILPSASPFAMLHEDTELTDFELRGEDGSVRVHRAVLAAASPVLRRMLSGTWREATEGRVEVPGTSKVTLQNLKDYVYLHTLPDNGLEPLLLLASCYMMKDLEQNCVFKLVSSLSVENVSDLLEFATKHKVARLILAVLECVENKSLKVDELRKHLLDDSK